MIRKIQIDNFVALLRGLGLFTILSVGVNAAPGDLDITFGTGGRVITQTGNSDKVNALAIQADGKIVVAGKRELPLYGSFLARYYSDGSLDQSFGVGGFVDDAAHGGHLTYLNAVAIQTDGKIVAAGYFYESGGCMRDQSWIVRYNADGSRDTTFGGDGAIEYGYLWVNSCPLNSYHHGLAIQNNGKIVAAGSAKNASSNFDFAAMRLNADGTLDASFNLDGTATFPIGTGNDIAYAAAIHSNTGKIVLAGYSYKSSTSNDFAMVMLNSQGLYDLSFGNGGKITTDFVGNDDRANAVAFQTDGKIIAAGQQSNASTGVDFALARYNSNGTLDSSFGTGGKVKTVFGAFYDIAYGINVRADGKIVAAGYGRDWSDMNANFAVARYNANGTLDTSFSGDGKQTADFSGFNDYGRAVAIQTDGKIVVAGYAFNGTENDIALVRYLP